MPTRTEPDGPDRDLNPKQSGIGRTSNSGIAGTNLVNLDPDDTTISSASQVRPDKTTSASPARQTSESDRETPDDSQIPGTSVRTLRPNLRSLDESPTSNTDP